MVCIHCGHETRVTNSRPQRRANQVWRRRACAACGSLFSTIEAVDFATSLRVRGRDQILTPFTRDRLFLSLHKSLEHRPYAVTDAAGLTSTIMAKVAPRAQNGLVEARQIVQIASVALTRFDKLAATHYQALHKL